ncbi:hypothetical protein [Hyalangium sp.]|uniref:hypothetical protein n=1 Tax=Hyalangium sp. TaxID=2028555 RepID=UPI002D2FCF26|nr:hypothetical protein [Hyalangium sp.]HYH95419.1 hypothetical protein [Hyalangium sp.]
MSEELKRPEQSATSQETAPAKPTTAEQEQFTPQLAREFFLSVLDYGQEEHEAKAGILQELMDLLLPEAKAIAQPIRSKTASDARSPEALEQQFGVTVREHAVDWLSEPAVRLAGLSRRLEPRTTSPSESGGELRRELFLLTDGRLVTVETVTTWFIKDAQRVGDDTLVGARAVDSAEALRSYDFVSILKVMLETLFDGAEFLKERHQQSPDIVERSGRFFTIIAQVAVSMKENADQLRKVGDTLA